MNYHFKIHKEGTGFGAQCIELQGCVTQANTMKELQSNMQEALDLYIDEPSDSKDLAALPDESIKKSKNIVTVAPDPLIAFAFLVRYFRIKHGLTQQQAAKRMGFDTIYSYHRLETGTCNPSLKLVAKVKQLFPDFSIDYAIGNNS